MAIAASAPDPGDNPHDRAMARLRRMMEPSAAMKRAMEPSPTVKRMASLADQMERATGLTPAMRRAMEPSPLVKRMASLSSATGLSPAMKRAMEPSPLLKRAAGSTALLERATGGLTGSASRYDPTGSLARTLAQQQIGSTRGLAALASTAGLSAGANAGLIRALAPTMRGIDTTNNALMHAVGIGVGARPKGLDALMNVAGLNVGGRPTGLDALLGLTRGHAAPYAPSYDSTAYVSQVQRALGRTNMRAFEQSVRGFAPPAPAGPLPFVIPHPDTDTVREVFAAVGIELAETDVAARAAFVDGYLWACGCRYSVAGRLVAWAVGIVGASLALYGHLTQSDAATVAGALGVLVAVSAFPDLRPNL